MSSKSKHILGIGQTQAGKVVIIHSNHLQCDHATPITLDCALCEPAEPEPAREGHYRDCVCADCSGAVLDAEND
jgi:hypothetical protein